MSRLYSELNTRLGCRGLCIKTNKKKGDKSKVKLINLFVCLLFIMVERSRGPPVSYTGKDEKGKTEKRTEQRGDRAPSPSQVPGDIHPENGYKLRWRSLLVSASRQ